ncbi:MAG: porin [Rhodocyclales bacterium]|nr:porin [Rhodocyclales bacterium]
MQKKIIALAVAALASSAAFAQTNVTVYGVADAYVGSFKTDDAKRATQVNSGGLGASRIGFKGAEDLGNGLKAIFALEYRLDIDANAALGTNAGVSGPARQQLVGLTGGFGTAVAGRLQTTAYDWAVSYDVLAGTAISPLQNVTGATTLINGGKVGFIIGGTANGARAENAVAYISPSFGGVTLAYNRAYLAEQNYTDTKASGVDVSNAADMLSANYKAGDLAAGVVYTRVKDRSTATLANSGNYDQVTDWAVGASYDFKVVKALATYQRTKAKGSAAGNSWSDKADSAWSVGLAAPVSAAGTIIASYAKNSIKSSDTPLLSPADNTKSYTLAYTHGLSKRTTAYAGYTSIQRDNGILLSVNNVANNTLATGAGGRDTTAFVAGINHKF